MVNSGNLNKKIYCVFFIDRSTGGMAGSFSEAVNIIYSGANTPSNAVSAAIIPNGGIAGV